MEMVRCNEIRRQLMDLPTDLLVDILLRLPVESLRYCIRRVCKTLLNTVDSRSFTRQHTLSLIAGNNHVVCRVPQLMCLFEETPPPGEELMCLFEETPINITTFATLQSLRYDGGTALTKGEFTFTHSTSSPYLPGYMIHFVFYNLLCLEADGHCLLINPLLKQVLTLPTDNIRQLDMTKYGPNCRVSVPLHGMGFDDITNTYKIVRVSRIWHKEDYLETLGMLAHILVLGTNSWREIPSVPPCMGLTYAYNLCAYGDMHWLMLRRRDGGVHILSFDFKREEFHWTPVPTLQSSNKNSILHMLSLRGSMAIVETFPLGEGATKFEIWVMKDYTKKEWAREYSMNVDVRPKFGLRYATCGEWEHGIFFNDHNIFKSEGTTRLFLDLRSASCNTAICPLDTESFVKMKSYSYTGSLISLRDFGTLGYSTDEPASS